MNTTLIQTFNHALTPQKQFPFLQANYHFQVNTPTYKLVICESSHTQRKQPQFNFHFANRVSLLLYQSKNITN